MAGIFFNSFSFVWGLHTISEELRELYYEEEVSQKRNSSVRVFSPCRFVCISIDFSA